MNGATEEIDLDAMRGWVIVLTAGGAVIGKRQPVTIEPYVWEGLLSPVYQYQSNATVSREDRFDVTVQCLPMLLMPCIRALRVNPADAVIEVDSLDPGARETVLRSVALAEKRFANVETKSVDQQPQGPRIQLAGLGDISRVREEAKRRPH